MGRRNSTLKVNRTHKPVIYHVFQQQKSQTMIGKASTVSTDERRQMLEQELEALRICWRYMPVERRVVRNNLRVVFEQKEKMQKIDKQELSRIEDDLVPASSSANKKKDATNHIEIENLRRAQELKTILSQPVPLLTRKKMRPIILKLKT